MFDLIVITTANEAQAAGYREQIAWRRTNGFFNSGTETMVVTDPRGRRVGSLGATLNVLVEIARQAKGDPFTGRRILICHSGGDSRRTPAYAAPGKVFTPLPCVTEEGRPLALFDLIVREADRLPARKGGQVIVLSGDVLVTVDPSAIDFSPPGLTGVAWRAEMATGARHGAYVPSGESSDSCRPVKDFLQKPSAADATAAGATDQYGRVAVDTGILSLDPSLCHVRGHGGLAEGCWLARSAQLGASSILTGVPRSCTVSIHLPKETGLVCLPVGEKDWTAISYRLDDNFKTDGKWEMPLWHTGAIDDAVAHALDLLRPGGKPAHGKGRVHSLASIIPRVNHARLRQARSEILREVARRRVAASDPFCSFWDWKTDCLELRLTPTLQSSFYNGRFPRRLMQNSKSRSTVHVGFLNKH